MKTLKKISAHTILLAFLFSSAFAQKTNKPSIAVLNIQSIGVIPDAQAVGRMARIELEKAGSYNVFDMYDVTDVLKKNNIDINSCFGKSCLLEAGKALNADKMLTGNIERIAEKIAITMKIINVSDGLVEKSYTQEYLNLQKEIQKMIELSINHLVGITTDPNVENLLVNYDQPIETPATHMLLSGPRMGASFTTGETGQRLKESKNNGGYDMYPVTFQIGWQHEVQYLSSGNFQGLFEFVGLIGGLESGKFIPSISVLNGFRFGKQGYEFAVGPTFRVVTKADGYYTTNEQGDKTWHLENEWPYFDEQGNVNPNPNDIVSRLDSRGDPSLSVGLVLAGGRTFKSGYLNMPVNVYVSPRKDGWIYGLSFGFNIRKKEKVEN